jgi:hypothetical protein
VTALDIATDRLPWERQPKESEKAYAAYRSFMEQTPPRRVTDVVERTGKSISLLYRWSTKHHWLARTMEYDLTVERGRQAELADARREMNTRHAAIAKHMSAKVAQRIKDLQPDELTPGELGRWMQVIAMVERLALGEVTERTEATGDPSTVINVTENVEQQVVFDRDHIGEVLDRLAARGIVPGPSDDGGPDVLDVAAYDAVHPNGSNGSTGSLPAGPTA